MTPPQCGNGTAGFVQIHPRHRRQMGICHADRHFTGPPYTRPTPRRFVVDKQASVQSSRWQRFRAALLAKYALQRRPCGLCGGAIDYTLTGRHPMAPSVDHLVARHHGGATFDEDNCRPAHYGCNSRRGARYTSNPRLGNTAPPSRVW